jgi:hypothetical protein
LFEDDADARWVYVLDESLDAERKCCIVVVRALRHHGPVDPMASMRDGRLYNVSNTCDDCMLRKQGDDESRRSVLRWLAMKQC